MLAAIMFTSIASQLLGDDADTDKSDKSTRDKHKVVIRPDGRAVIKAMQSENNVVKKFKLRSNSIVVNPDAMGALQAAEAEFKNIEMEAIARKKVSKAKQEKRILTLHVRRDSSPRITLYIGSGNYSCWYWRSGNLFMHRSTGQCHKKRTPSRYGRFLSTS